MNPYVQEGFQCRAEWGPRGAQTAAERGDIVVVVDVLSFSSAVATAVERGAIVYPCPHGHDAAAEARERGAELAVRRGEVPAKGRFSLSPRTLRVVEPGTRVLLPSLNGALCARLAGGAAQVLAGSLLNAGAVAGFVNRLLQQRSGSVTVVPCGERWHERTEEGNLRFALEDALGAGAILAALGGSKSPEALHLERAFLGSRSELEPALLECASGRELCADGFRGDVEHIARLDAYRTVPVLREGAFSDAGPEVN